MIQKPTHLFAVLLAFLFALGEASGALGQEPRGGREAKTEIVQQTCPVMVGNKIDPNIYTDYWGKRVYFCCQKCKAAFEANPGKYLDRLPQFAGRRAGSGGEGRSGRGPSGVALRELVEPFGLATLSLLIVTFCFGYFMKKSPKVLFKWHRRVAYVTIVVALCHATLVFLAHNL